mmetsp:Transcript_30814/g.67269  ORF Transcript_30814/g.67269 Transcript_30814/m.67269 type:complete len:243 (-) Transcript_30814:314-1042(-)|eukprot:CAMPEP_0118924280 /NCGR_PEP_ID=MMETSP1169-20130426/2489_1 /TAXON_ID=36882 /ORGANISM="Pyramimonas obovata, Strain CCMP722" /LENGTH=242 /DNA_ID=CAMNT_0006865377 /DNA_START=137 /DNA_END=865 /DNA_ORIENTATION=+
MATDSKTMYFFATTSAILTFSVFGFVPIMGVKIYFYSYRLAMLTSMLAFGFRPVYSLKRPAFSLAGLREWAVGLINQNNVQYVLFASLFLTGRPITIALGPLVICSAYQWITIASKLLDGNALWERFGKGLFKRLEEGMVQSLVMVAAMEIATAFYLIVEMFTQTRSALRLVLYWNYLRMRYRCTDDIVLRLKYAAYNTAFYHQEVWKIIGHKLGFVLNIPQIQPLVNFLKVWFTGNRAHTA